MSSQAAIPADTWEAHRCQIQDLYIAQDLPLAQVISVMSSHGFRASKPQYDRQFKKWSISKNRKAKEWKIISKILARRNREGKTSIVTIDGREIPLGKVSKETRRYDLPSLMPRSPTPELMDYIRVHTPTSFLNSTLDADGPPQREQLIEHQASQNGRPFLSVVVDNIPTLVFMDLLDLNSEI